MQLIITVDAEADNQWDVEAPQTTANLAAMPRFQRLCDRFGFPPTYLCTQEIVTSPNFRGTIAAYASDGRAEVGAHLHPWSTPPFDAAWDGIGAARPYPSELPRRARSTQARHADLGYHGTGGRTTGKLSGRPLGLIRRSDRAAGDPRLSGGLLGHSGSVVVG